MGFENVGQIEINKKSGETLAVKMEKPVAAGEMLYINLNNVKEIIAGTKDYTSVARRTDDTN